MPWFWRRTGNARDLRTGNTGGLHTRGSASLLFRWRRTSDAAGLALPRGRRFHTAGSQQSSRLSLLRGRKFYACAAAEAIRHAQPKADRHRRAALGTCTSQYVAIEPNCRRTALPGLGRTALLGRGLRGHQFDAGVASGRHFVCSESVRTDHQTQSTERNKNSDSAPPRLTLRFYRTAGRQTTRALWSLPSLALDDIAPQLQT